MDEMEQQIMFEMSENLQEQKQSTETIKFQIEKLHQSQAKLIQSQAKLIQSLENLETMMPRFFSQTSIPPRPPSQPPDPPDFNKSNLKFDGTLSELLSLKQCGDSVEMYLEKFDCALSRLSLSMPYAVNIFLSNMNPHLASRVKQFDVTTVAYAAWLAKLFESSAIQPRAPFSPYQNQNNQSHDNSPNTTSLLPPLETTKTLPYKPNFPTETNMEKSPQKLGMRGLCMSYDGSYANNHHLESKKSRIFVVECDDEESFDVREPSEVTVKDIIDNSVDMIREEKSTPEIESSPEVSPQILLSQFEVLSSLEPSRRSHSEQLGVSDDFPFAIVRTHISQSQSDLKCVTGKAHRMFDVMPLETKPLKNKRKKALQKTWWFKFKTSLERSKLMDDKLSFMEVSIEKDITKLGAQQGFKIEVWSGFDLEACIGFITYGWEFKKQINIGHISLKGMCNELAYDKDKKKEKNIEGDVKEGKNRNLGEGKIILALAVKEYMIGKADEMLLLGHCGLLHTFDQCGGLNATVIAGIMMQSSLKSFHQLRVACLHNTSLGFLYGSLPRPPEENHSNFSNMLQYHETWSCISLGESLFFLKKLLSRPIIVGDVTGLTQNKAVTKALVHWKEHPPDQFYPENNCCYGLHCGLDYNVGIRSAIFMDGLNSVCKLLFGAFVLNLIAEQTRDWSFFGLLLQWKWHPPPQATSEFHQAHNDKPVFHL